MGRTFSLALEVKSGHVHDFSATVGGRLVIAADGSQKRTFSQDLPDEPVPVRLWVTGVPGSQYTVTVDLPGKVNDFTWRYTLAATLQGVEFDV